MWLLDPGNGQMSRAPPPSATSWLFAVNGGYSAGGSSHSQDSHLQGSNSTTAPGYVGLLQDLNTGAAAALGYSGHVHSPQVSSHNLGPGMTAIGDHPNNWPQTPHMNLLAFADEAAAAASKVPFFTPLMLSQMDAGHRLHAAEFGGFPMSSVPNLNSSLERTISMRTRDVMPYPRTPVSLEKNKLVPDCLPREVIDLVDDSPSDENIWEETGKSQTPIAKQAELCVSQHVVQSSSTSAKPVYPGTALPFEEFLSQQQQTETRAIVSSEEGTDQPLNAETQGKLEINGIDPNKTPQQKPKRKKHRPKVIREGKPARTPKPATPKPVNPSGKRKYVRRNKAQVSSEIPFSEPGKTALPISSPGIESAGSSARNIEDNPSGKRKYVWRKKVDNSSDNTPSISRGAADPDGSGGKKSVRRCLNFDSEAPEGVDGCPGSMPLFTNTAESKAQEACLTGNIIKIDVEPSVHHTRALDVENSVPGVPFFLHSSTDQMPNEYIRFSGNPISHHQPSETVRTDQILDKCRKMPENPATPPQPSRRENLKKLARKKFLGISSGPDRSQEPDIIQLDLHGTPNLLVKRAKINQILDHDAQISTNVNPLHACGGVEKLAAFYDVNCHEPYLSQGYKEQRTEHACGFAPSSASSMCMPSNDWRSHQVALDAADAFTSADAPSFMGLKKQLASEGMEAFDQTENNTGRRSEVSLKRHSATSVSSEMEVSHITNTGNQSGQNAMDHNKLFTPLQPFAGDDTQRGQNHEALACMETQVVRTKSGMKTKRGRKRKTELKNHLINTNKIDLQGQKPASFSLEYCLGQKIAKATASTSRDFREEVSRTSSISGSNSGAIVPYGDPLDEIIQKLRHLTVNGFCNFGTAEAQNAIVPYGDGIMVPYGSLFDLTKKRRPRPKVDLDPETNRVWNLLMGKVGGVGGEGTEAEKEKLWEEERRVFRGRVESFIARMHLVQGDRRFSKWKGSVVDSAVGVFLTQNVSDHLSSSAFMALAARFPLKSRCNSSEPSSEPRNSGIKHDDSSEVALDGTSKSKEQVSRKGLHDRSSLVIVGDNETANSNESFGSNTSGVAADYSKVECLNSKETVIGVGHDSPDTEFGTPITLTGSTGVAEAEDRWSAEDAGSSQNSVSSQNSSEIPVQVADQIGISSLSHTKVEELTIRSMYEGIDNSTSFTELLNSVLEVSGSLRDINSCMTTSITNSQDANHVKLSVPAAAPLPCDPCHFNYSSNSGLVVMECLSAPSDGKIFHQDSNSVTTNANKFENMESLNEHSTGNISEVIKQKNLAARPRSLPEASAEAESCLNKQFSCPSNLQTNISETPPGESISQKCSLKFQQEEKRLFEVESTKQAVQFQLQKQNFNNQQSFPNMNNNRNPLDVSERVQLYLKDNAYTANKVSSETPTKKSKEKKVRDETERKKTYDWDSLRKEVHWGSTKKERSCDTMDSIDWEAVRCAEVNEISQTIRERGMNNLLAERIKEFLNRLVRDHGSIDLEWLREIEPDKAKDYLLSIRGLGLKSVECVRLLTLQHLAFPVDTNVGRICVRLGWVPLQPLPESLQLHLLELYPVLETIQKYLWPRLCKLDQRTLYELHYQMITFGKVFCTKSKPNCNACPMRGECKHFASAFASARLALPGPQEKSLVSTTVPIASDKNHVPILNPTHIPQIEGINNLQARAVSGNCEPIVEEPATPEPECIQIEQSAIEDAFYEDPEEIPTIKLNIEEFTQNLQNYMQANNMELQDVDMSKALVAINPEAASIPMPKLKNASRLRTEHHVYELPDSHPLLEGLDPREPDDPSSYLLAIWTPGETAQSTEPPQASCNSQETGAFCNIATCFSCNSRLEAQAQIVRATILIPCRTAMRGSFPLNGTYFQVNEVFADHDTSRNPIDVPREWIWNLPRRTVYFGTSVPTIFKGLTTEEIQLCFWRGFVCVRGFDRKTRAPRPLYARLHFPASKAPRHRQQEKSSPAKRTANRN